VLSRLRIVGAKPLGALGPDDVAPIEAILRWHPTEATALLAAAALGITGIVDLRRGEDPIPLTPDSPAAWAGPLSGVLQAVELPGLLAHSNTLEQAHDIARAHSVSELDHEREKAARQTNPPTWDPETLAERSQQYAREALAQGATLITTRRLAEALSVPGPSTPDLLTWLASLPDSARGPLWDLRTLAGTVPTLSAR